MKDRAIWFRQVWVLDLSLLRAGLGGRKFLYFSIDFFLRFGFGLGIVDLGLLSDVVEVEQLLARLRLSPENLPQRLLLLKFFRVHLSRLHSLKI